MLNQLDKNKYPLFVSFLKDNNIYDSYKENVTSISNLNMPHLAISGAFIFVCTKEGADFWYKINDMWHNHYKQFKDESI